MTFSKCHFGEICDWRKMMFCSGCGSKLMDEAVFCSECGMKISSREAHIQEIRIESNVNNVEEKKSCAGENNSLNIAIESEKDQIANLRKQIEDLQIKYDEQISTIVHGQEQIDKKLKDMAEIFQIISKKMINS